MTPGDVFALLDAGDPCGAVLAAAHLRLNMTASATPGPYHAAVDDHVPDLGERAEGYRDHMVTSAGGQILVQLGDGDGDRAESDAAHIAVETDPDGVLLAVATWRTIATRHRRGACWTESPCPDLAPVVAECVAYASRVKAALSDDRRQSSPSYGVGELVLFDQHRLYADLDAVRLSRGLSWRQVATEAGVSASLLSRLALAFGSLAFLSGQIVGKGWVTLAAVGILATARHRKAVPA